MAEKLTLQQQAAVTDRGGKLLVSAAAGSGKTKVLVDRLIGYLTDPVDPANLDEFLIITYTKAAASELRGKIASKLSQLISEQPDNRHLRRQMQRLYLAKISTVHSFCADILKEYAYELDIPADFRVADETECAQIQLQALEKVLDEAYELASDDQDFCALIDTQGLGRDDRQIPQIILNVYQSSRCHLDPDGWLKWCCECTNTDLVSDVSQTIWGAYLLNDLKDTIQLHIKALSRCVDLAVSSIGMEKPVQLLQYTIEQLGFLQSSTTWDEVLQRKNIDYGRLTFSKKCTDLDLAERIKGIRSACKSSIEKKLNAFTDTSEQVLEDLYLSTSATRGLIELVNRFAYEYERRKYIRRILDFGDLEHKMLDLLIGRKRNTATVVATELSNRYREIMVDEYQDSNGVQDAIFSALTQKRQNCFMVGDVKQSIYQFRLADPSIFVDKYNKYLHIGQAALGEGRKVMLSSNFRSSAGVINAVNDVFTTCMSTKVGGLFYGEEELLREGIPHIDIGEQEVELYGIDVQTDTYFEEAAFVAKRIQELLDGTHMVRQGDTLRAIAPDDIVILLRSPGSVGNWFVSALEKKGIRCTTGGSVNLLQTEEVSVLCSILQIINNPQQDIPLLAVLMSRVFSFTADDLAGVRAQNKRSSIFDLLTSIDDNRIKDVICVLNQLRLDSRLYSLTDLLQRIFEYTKMDSIYAAMADGDSKTANLQAFCRIAADYEASGQKDLGQFLDHLAALEEKGLVLPGQLQESGAVTVMSIHKSKGLEFPVVFLCGLSRRFNQESARGQVLCHKELGLGLSCVDSEKRIRYPTVAKKAISIKIMEESISEELRVLYVAMTRARDRLIMTYASSDLEGDLLDISMRIDHTDPVLMTSEVSCPGDWILQTAMRRTEAGELFAIGGHPDCARVSDSQWLIKTVVLSESNDTHTLQKKQRLAVPENLMQRIKEGLSFSYTHRWAVNAPSKQTATQLKGRFKDQEVAQDAVIPSMHTFRKASFSKAYNVNVEYGNAMHNVMQYIRYEACEDISGVNEEIRRLVQEQYISTEHAQLADANKIATLFASDIGKKLMMAENLLREFKFSVLENAEEFVRGAVDDEILIQGVVDCAVIEPDGITVIDYKTDRITPENMTEKIGIYAQQIQIYAKALQRIYELPIKQSFLYFFSIDQFVPIEIK